MKPVYNNIIQTIDEGKKLLAVLIDPDKFCEEGLGNFIEKVNASVATHIFLGGSEVVNGVTELIAKRIRPLTDLPIILFPGDEDQLTDYADGLLFLSLISGRNPEYLIEKHIKAVPKLNELNLEVIPTGYILLENGRETSVERISKTNPLPRNNINLITNTAKAGEYLGMKLIYLEAGSGAIHPVESHIISKVKSQMNIPLIVGGGIRSRQELQDAYDAGADMVVIGTALEQNLSFFNEIRKVKTKQP